MRDDQRGPGKMGTLTSISYRNQVVSVPSFPPGSSQDTTVTFTNTTGAPAVGVQLSISVPNKQ